MTISRRYSRTVARLALVGAMAALMGCATSDDGAAPSVVSASATPGRVVGLRRLTETQYHNAVADIFGDDIKIDGRFEPIGRPEQGLIADGASQSAVSPAGFEQFDSMARAIAAQVLDPAHRASFLSCKPVDPTRADPACARTFFTSLGLYIFRRPLTTTELDFFVDLAGRGAGPTGDFYKGLQLGLASMLISPQFLYRVETAAQDDQTLDGYSKASRLSFLIWNSTPDRALLDAAARGDLDTQAGLAAQVDRMLASPRAEQGVRAFFTDFLELDRVVDLSKDTVVYPLFNVEVAQDLSEQTLRTVVDVLMTEKRPYPDLFTTRKTFLNRRLGLVYGAPVKQENGWAAYEFPADDGRAGILGQGAFLALFSHEGRSSPTLRGRAIREVLLCQPVPNPPANVDFSGFNDTTNAVLRTARQRLTHHATDPVCASCHHITDPLGLPLERFDGMGAPRERENGTLIDTSGTFEGHAFDGEVALSALLGESETANACVSQRLAEYAVGRSEDDLPKGWVDALAKGFKTGGYNFPALLKAVATSPQFYTTTQPKAPPAKVAQLARPEGQEREIR